MILTRPPKAVEAAPQINIRINFIKKEALRLLFHYFSTLTVQKIGQ